MALFKFEIYRDLATHDLVISARITETDLWHAHKMMRPCELDLMGLLQKGTAADGFYWIAEMARALEEYDRREGAAQGGAGMDPKDGEVEADSRRMLDQGHGDGPEAEDSKDQKPDLQSGCNHGATSGSKRVTRVAEYDEPGWEAWAHDDGRLYYWPVIEAKDGKRD